MSAHITFSDTRFALNDGETVLDCLTRNGVDVPHSCRSGICQSCLMQATTGDIPSAAQAGLKPTYLKQSLFLSCQCKPTGEMTVRLLDDDSIDTPVEIAQREMLNHNVLRICLKTDAAFTCEPGQYITLINPDGTARSYSVANDPVADGHVELHIRLLADGLMSRFLMRDGAVGSRLTLRGPAGSCFYAADADSTFPIILAGTGTGLAPLYGIIKQALAKGHQGEIRIFHGALKEDDLYLIDSLRALAQSHPHLHYMPCVLNGSAGRHYTCGHIEDIVAAALPADKSELRLFLCGAPEFVTPMRRKAFLSGVRSSHIFADAFLPSKKPDIAA